MSSLTSYPATPPTEPCVSSSPAGRFLLDDPAEQSAYTLWSVHSDGQREAVSQFRVTGIVCAACAAPIEAALCAVPGVRDAQVSVACERVQVRWLPDETCPSLLIAAVQRAGYDALPDVAASERQLRAKDTRLLLWRVFVAGFCMILETAVDRSHPQGNPDEC